MKGYAVVKGNDFNVKVWLNEKGIEKHRCVCKTYSSFDTTKAESTEYAKKAFKGLFSKIEVTVR